MSDVKGAPQGQTLQVDNLKNPSETPLDEQPSAPEQQDKIYEKSTAGSLRQGEILSGLIQSHLNVASLELADGPTVDYRMHPYAIVMAQDCDLIQDFDVRRQNLHSDKLIPNVLFCEAVTAEELKGRADIKSDIWKRIRQNKDERYQFLESVPVEADWLGAGVPELGLDFKRYFSVPTDEVYYWLKRETKRRGKLVSPYVEHLSARFFYFHSRVALPAEHRSL